MILRYLFVALACLQLESLPAIAADDKDATVQKTIGGSSKREDAMKLVELDGTVKMVRQGIELTTKVMASALPQATDCLVRAAPTEKDYEENAKGLGRIRQKYIPYELIRELITFYESDAGKCYSELMPTWMADFGARAEEFMSRGKAAKDPTKMFGDITVDPAKAKDIRKLFSLMGSAHDFSEQFSQPVGSAGTESSTLFSLARKKTAKEAVEEYMMWFFAENMTHKQINEVIAFHEGDVGRRLKEVGPKMRDEQTKIANGIAGKWQKRMMKCIQPSTNEEKSMPEDTDKDVLVEKTAEVRSIYDDMITTWEVSGPYEKEGASLFDFLSIPFAPEKEGVGARWKRVKASPSSPIRWKVDLGKILGGEQRAAYLRTRVWSSVRQRVLLKIGSDDGVMAWLNEKIVHKHNIGRMLRLDEDSVEVTLNEGWNTLMLKISQGVRGWEVCARFRSLDNQRLEGLRYK